MLRTFLKIGLVTTFVQAAMPAFAENAAMVIVNEDYIHLSDTGHPSGIRGMRNVLRQNEYSANAGTDQEGLEMQGMGAFFAQQSAEADRTLVLLQGHFVNNSRDTWLLGVDADTSTNALTIGGPGLSVGVILDILGQRPGRSVLLLVPSENAPENISGLSAGPGALSVPQGVTVAIGTRSDINSAVTDVLLREGGTTRDLAGGNLRVMGFVSDAVEFTPTAQSGATPYPDTDLLFWQVVRSIGTVNAYQAYLDQFPDGNNANQARNAIDQLQNAPQREAEAAEAALNLNRDERREIQRALSLLGYDTRGIDGIFGPGTRGAITQWQSQNTYENTGYLTREQIQLLDRQARRRAQELEEEARERQEELERQDRAYWQTTGASGTEDGLRAYLERYPDGLFADVAETRLTEIEAERLRELQGAERGAWDEARDADTIQSYRRYLRFYPNGLFAATAEQRISELEEEQAQQPNVEQYERNENQIVGNPLARILVERQLASLGYETGTQDGNFDQRTRRAIRRFQRDHGMDVTGYVNQSTMVRLMMQ